MTMQYAISEVQPLLQAGLADQPLLLVAVGVVLCATIAVTTLSALRRVRTGQRAAAGGLSPSRLAFKLVTVGLVLLAAAGYLWAEYGGFSGIGATLRGEPCCAEAADQPRWADDGGQACCPPPANGGTSDQDYTGKGRTGGQSGGPGEDMDK
jgi:hypothetical protein